MNDKETQPRPNDWFIVLMVELDYGIFLQFGGSTKDELDWEIEREFSSKYDPPRPPSLGLWIWEGVMGEEGESTNDIETDTWNLTFEGTFRRLLPHELSELIEVGKLQR